MVAAVKVVQAVCLTVRHRRDMAADEAARVADETEWKNWVTERKRMLTEREQELDKKMQQLWTFYHTPEERQGLWLDSVDTREDVLDLAVDNMERLFRKLIELHDRYRKACEKGDSAQKLREIGEQYNGVRTAIKNALEAEFVNMGEAYRKEQICLQNCRQ